MPVGSMVEASRPQQAIGASVKQSVAKSVGVKCQTEIGAYVVLNKGLTHRKSLLY